jgi:hypothetical protein
MHRAPLTLTADGSFTANGGANFTKVVWDSNRFDSGRRAPQPKLRRGSLDEAVMAKIKAPDIMNKKLPTSKASTWMADPMLFHQDINGVMTLVNSIMPEPKKRAPRGGTRFKRADLAAGTQGFKQLRSTAHAASHQCFTCNLKAHSFKLKKPSLNKMVAVWKVLPQELPQVQKYELRYRAVPGQRKVCESPGACLINNINSTFIFRPNDRIDPLALRFFLSGLQ